ncbi:MAG: response regulator [Thermoleophilia bacterium]
MSPRIMVIDDEKIVGDMAKISLEDEGYEVETFLNAEPALKRLGEDTFDIVVTDLKMKGIDGLQVLRTVKQNHPGTKVIMITAFADLDVAIEAIKGDVFDFFPKPVRIKDLKEAISKALAEGVEPPR